MPAMSSPLSAQRIAAHLTQHAASGDTLPAPHIAVEMLAETGSTNADLMSRLPQLQGPALLVAERQTAGRGRAGRSWIAEPGATLTFSLAWRFDLPLHQLTGLPIAVGVSIAEVLSERGASVSLKWPNDILKSGRKLGGILIETARDRHTGGSWAVVGIGLNRKQPQNQAAIGQAVAALDLPNLDINHLLGDITSRLAAAFTQFEQQGVAAFIAGWNKMHAHAGQQVRIMDGDKILHEGLATGLAGNGALLLQTANGVISVMSGDVSLRPVAEAEKGRHVATG